MSRRTASLAFAAFFSLLCLPAAAQSVQGRGSAVEGDVVVIDAVELKLTGIDAPDPGQRCVNGRGTVYDCFEESRLNLKRILDSGRVSCQVIGGGNFSQRRARCTVDGRDVGAYMVATGWAMAYRRIAPDYIPYETRAMALKRGFWNGRVEAPWLYRDRMLRGDRAAIPAE